MSLPAVPEMSPPEILMDYVQRWSSTDAPVVVGPADDADTQAGVIQMVVAGLPAIELYAPTVWIRPQIRVLGGTLDRADVITQSLQRDLHGRNRRRAYQASTGTWWLVHIFNVTAGPSQHYDSDETQEQLLFADVLLGTQPLDPADFG